MKFRNDDPNEIMTSNSNVCRGMLSCVDGHFDRDDPSCQQCLDDVQTALSEYQGFD